MIYLYNPSVAAARTGGTTGVRPDTFPGTIASLVPRGNP